MTKRTQVEEAILSVAASLFGRYGYEKTSVDEITRLAHKAKASIYYHYDGKLTIFKACLEVEFHNLMKGLDIVREKNTDSNAKMFALYLTTRMDLLLNMKVYRKYLSQIAPDLEDGELKHAGESVRRKFNDYEYGFYHEVAVSGIEHGTFDESISPHAFAQMVIGLFRGLEYRFL